MSWFWSSDKSTEKSSNVYEGLDADLKDFAKGQNRKAQTAPVPQADAQASQTAVQAAVPERSLDDALELYKQSTKARRSFINSGAVFNCAIAEYDLNECFRSGSWWDKAKLCELQKQTFWDCLNRNKHALLKNGYGDLSNSPEQNDALLAAADESCMRQIAAEKAAAEQTEK